MKDQKFPAGWDEKRVKELLNELDSRTDEEWVIADEVASNPDSQQTVITVPTSLMPEIRRLLASQKTA